MKYEAKVKGGKKGALEEEEEEEDEDSGIPHSNKNSRGRGVSEDINGHIDAEVEKAQDKMQKVVVWFTEKCEETISRGRGKVNGCESDFAPSFAASSFRRELDIQESPSARQTSIRRREKLTLTSVASFFQLLSTKSRSFFRRRPRSLVQKSL